MMRRKLRLREHQGVGERAAEAHHSSSSLAVLGRVAGQLEEDVVEGRPPHRDVVDPHPGVVQPLHRRRDRPFALGDRHPQHHPVELRPLRGDLGQRRDRRLRLVGRFQRHLEALAADLVLQLVGGALGDHLAVVDHRDPVGEPVGLVEVLGGEQHRRPVGDPPFDRLPEPDPAARVEPGRRLVEEEHRRPRDQRRGEVEPPPHPARVGAHQPAARFGEVEALQQLGRPRLRLALRQVVELADHLQVLEPGQVLVDRRVLAGEADPPAQLAAPRWRRRGPPPGRCRRRRAAAW